MWLGNAHDAGYSELTDGAFYAAGTWRHGRRPAPRTEAPNA
jgi:hypothetical protein